MYFKLYDFAHFMKSIRELEVILYPWFKKSLDRKLTTYYDRNS